MRELRLDHHRAATPRLGWKLFAASAVLALLVAHDYVTAANGLERITAHRARANPTAGSAEAERINQELQEANRVIADLATPWNALYDAIEQSRVSDVALLTAHPEPKQQSILLSGEAKTYEAMLGFARQLEGKGMLSGVHVQSHEVRQHDAQRPVYFTLAAQWRTKP